ncbi:ABC transporter ATP-binding protein [Solirubrobacter soli]|uniref:ABC transporter ATP-binding protein n=1 Tax=Solirubrobacter soli TaxID=363832 RepID=UPI0003F511DC|nr:sn-glycerol-3-phosphate ABC transporter ATP-binding protein UgpC [Solirubrobacter soli]
MASVTFDRVSKVYDNGFKAVDDLDLEIRDGEFMVLVGPSGCGKTTALRMLAGLEEISDGELVIDNTVVNEVAPQKRDIAMVFQNYALYPHLTVYDNMAYGLKIQKLSKAEIKQRVHEIAKVIGLEDLLERKPKALSGGQRQRVAMGRAIVRRPKVFLMDEPLSNLDAKLRVQMRSEVARIQHELQATTVYVTHDQVEAMTMGDRVALMRRGVLQQVDTPMNLYDNPANLFVASFIGSPAMNLFEATVDRRNGHLVATIGDQFLRLPQRRELDALAGRKLALGIRPEHLEDATVATGAPPELRLKAAVRGVEALGAELIAHLEVTGRAVLTDEVKEIAADLDATLVAELEQESADATLPLVGRFDVASRARTGGTVEVVVDTDKVHYFDLDTGAAIGRS